MTVNNPIHLIGRFFLRLIEPGETPAGTVPVMMCGVVYVPKQDAEAINELVVSGSALLLVNDAFHTDRAKGSSLGYIMTRPGWSEIADEDVMAEVSPKMSTDLIGQAIAMLQVYLKM